MVLYVYEAIGTLVILGCLLLTMTACGNESKTYPSVTMAERKGLSARKTKMTVDCNTDSDKEVRGIIINLQSTSSRALMLPEIDGGVRLSIC